MGLTATEAAAAFVGAGAACEPYGGGHINASYLVRLGEERWFLQRINRDVFPDPTQVMRNVTAVTAHVRSVPHEVSVPGLVPTKAGRPWLEQDGEVWRCAEFVEGVTAPAATGPAEAFGAAFAFGAFARAMSTYEGPPLAVTIAGLHDTAARVAQLEHALTADSAGRVAGVAREADELLARRALADVLPPLFATSALPCRFAHNDAKLANVLFERATGRARWVVDLDTVMPGTRLHDFGDLVRSGVAGAAEDAPLQDAEPARFEALVRGFRAGARDVLTPLEGELLETAGRLLAYEQAVRFLTDHLQGDAYYRIAYPGHNLARARAQLALLRSLERQTSTFARLALG